MEDTKDKLKFVVVSDIGEYILDARFQFKVGDIINAEKNVDGELFMGTMFLCDEGSPFYNNCLKDTVDTTSWGNMADNFYASWWFLFNHKMFQDEYGQSKFNHCLSVEVVKVNPINDTIDDVSYLNTKTQVWLEIGEYNPICKNHDIDLDCGGDTYELAIVELAKLVLYKWDE